MTTDGSSSEDGTTAPDAVAGPEPLGRGLAGGVVAVALLALAAGIAIYLWRAPDTSPGIATIELSGSDQGSLVDPGTIRTAVWWDFVLILGYGTALLLGAWLAKRVLWSTSGKRLARWCLLLAAATIGADVVENILLIAATHSTRTGWLDAVAALAVVKFCALLAAAVIVAGTLVTTVGRLAANRPSVLAQHKAAKVRQRWPLEGDLAAPHHDSSGGPGADRWRRGYDVPGLAAELAQRNDSEPIVGFCLSGGGVRSASVALGALQSLRSELIGSRYLASVSGGGYTAGALQLALTDAGTDALGDAGTPVRDPASALMPGSVDEDRFRRHARYIASSPAQMLVALGVLGRVVVLSIAVLFGPAVLLGALVGRWYDAVPLVAWQDNGLDPSAAVSFPDIPVATWIDLAVLGAAAMVCYALTVIAGAYRTKPLTRLRDAAKGLTAFALLVAAVALALPAVAFGASWILHKAGPTLAVGGPIVSVLLAYLTTVASLGRQKKVRSAVGGLFKGRGSPVAAVPTGALQLLLVVVTLLVLALGWLLLFGGVAAVAHKVAWWELALIVLALGFLGGALDQTALSLHPFYRRRTAAAFSARRVTRPDGNTVAFGYSYGERTTLSDYAARASVDGRQLPEPIYVAAANLTGEERAPLNAVSFTFTGGWVGGPDVGYVATADLQAAVKEQLKRDLTVQAAVAISGAAVASAMGRSGRWFGALLAITGVRLGTWLPNPGHIDRWNKAVARQDWTMAGPPRLRRLPYLLREVLGLHSVDDRLLQVTDGGHYENLGLIELFRRRCTKIYCIDSSGDAPPTAGTLAAAITLAHEELGVTVDLPPDTWKLAPGTGAPLGESSGLAGLSARLSAAAVVVAPFHYPEESGLPGQRDGTLIVAKALLTPDLPYDLLAYAASNGVFPHDSTSDQFFDDAKYCAYTALGREIGLAMRGVDTLAGLPTQPLRDDARTSDAHAPSA